MSYLLDTDVCSAYIKGNRHVANRFLLHTGGLHINSVILGELLTWVLRANAPPSRRRALDELLRDITVLDVTADVGRKFGEVRAGLYDQGLPMPVMDLLIAATALVHNLTLVTHNANDYSHVPGLRTADWLIP